MAAGFAGGYYFNAKKSADLASAGQTPAQPEPPKPNHTTYKISPPSRGAVLKTFPVDIKTDSNAATVTLDAVKAADVKKEQGVLLYDANNALLDILGKVIAITPNADGTISVDMILDADTAIPATLVSRGEIILERRTDAQRLPLTALVRDKNSGEPYLWEVNKSEDGTFKAFYKRTNLLMETPDFIVVETPASHSNVFVLHADEALEDGQTVNTVEDLYSAPPLTRDQIVMANIETRHPTPHGPDPYTGPDFPSSCSLTNNGDIVPGTMSLPKP